MQKSINIHLTGNEGPAMRLGILLTRIERKETIESYPISSFEKDRLLEILKQSGQGYMFSIKKADHYWYFFNAKYIGEVSLN